MAAALALLVACNAMTGADALGVGPEQDESEVVGTSSGAPGGTKDAGSVAVPPPHGRQPPGSEAGTTPQTDAGFDASTSTPPGFSDSFDRADGTIGNGWVAKTNGFFSLTGGAVLQTGTGRYENLVVSRPETTLDVQASLDVVFAAHPDSDPSIHVRMLPASDTANELVGYTFYVMNDFAAIDREDPGENGDELASATISPDLEQGKAYRMIFRVTGTDPVKLEATVIDAASGAAAATLSTSDGSGKRITVAGRVGFGSGRADNMRFDNFVRVDL
jgi:hypothetical protein